MVDYFGADVSVHFSKKPQEGESGVQYFRFEYRQFLCERYQYSASTANFDKMTRMFRAIVFFALITAALGSEKLDVLVNAAASFSATIQQQLEMLQSDPSPAEIAEKTIDYAEAKAFWQEGSDHRTGR